MYKIESAEFKTESFRNGDSKTWNEKILECDRLASPLEEGCKELFYSLASHGYAHTVLEHRAQAVVNAICAAGTYAFYKVENYLNMSNL
ncbi:hypothetical protein [Paenibacillus sp. MMO-177]|uniref:hypothetical protein n=1 Tax=Paenibacillus sp. MMO-177 TaxID=3081289 RepID=UPI003017FAE2